MAARSPGLDPVDSATVAAPRNRRAACPRAEWVRDRGATSWTENRWSFNKMQRHVQYYAGDLSYKTYGNINAAEKSLGIDIDGVADSAHTGPVTVIFGNTDGGKDADFAIVIYGKPEIDATDFIFG